MKYEEDNCALISVKRLELSGEMLIDGEIAKFTLGGYGTILRSLSKFIDIRYSIKGTMKIDGETIVDGKRIRYTCVGPIIIDGNEKLIGY